MYACNMAKPSRSNKLMAAPGVAIVLMEQMGTEGITLAMLVLTSTAFVQDFCQLDRGFPPPSPTPS